MAKTNKLVEYSLEAAKVGRILLEPEPTLKHPTKGAHFQPKQARDMTIDQAITGIITAVVDVMSIRGKAAVARKLKPNLHASFKEPGSVIHRLLDAKPDSIDQWGRYVYYPSGKRHKVIRQHIKRKEWQELLSFAIPGFMFLADLYESEGITLVEAERLINQGFKEALTSITLKELVGAHGNVYENEIRDALSKLRLSTGSVGGADKRLKYELDQHYGPDYEQDLKIALWECSTGNNHMITEMLKALEGVPPDERTALFVRMVSGKEPGLMRDTLIGMIRKTITDLPDISDAIQERRAYEDSKVVKIPLDDTLNTTEDVNSQRTREDIELRANLNQLTPRELDIYQGELERLEANKTRDEWYGHKKAECVKQQLKYMKSKYT